MAVEWSWNAKKGEVIIARVNYKNLGKVERFKLNIYQANCLGAFIYEYKDSETKKDMYNFYTFFNDIKHLKRCLGLESCSRYDYNKHRTVLDKTNILCDKNEWWEKVRLNTYYSDVLKIADVFTRAGIKVELYYKKPKGAK